MLNIAICDNDPIHVRTLRENIERYMAETGTEFGLTEFYDGSELLENYDPRWDVIFLDIQMDQVDGLTAAARVREIDTKVHIFFLTSFVQYALEGYRVRAVNYLVKPLKYARLRSELSRLPAGCGQADDPYIIVKNDAGTYKIYYKDLRYLETSGRNLMLHTGERSIICYRTMREMEEMLKTYGFSRCHSGFLVNLMFVRHVEKYEITLLYGENLPISQPRRKQFMEGLTNYWGSRL